MESESSREATSYDRPPQVSVRFVLCVLLGLYLAGYLAFRLQGEPYGQVDYDDSPRQHMNAIRGLWESDEDVSYKAFQSFYWPCLMAEDWLIREVLS